MSRLQSVLNMIDAANAADPNETDGQPDCLIYGQRMSEELARLFPDASEPLQIATRGQHIERWVLKRADYPEGREGYLTWRRDLARHHADRVTEIMTSAGYEQPSIDAAQRMILKQGIKRDAEVQSLEDVICFVFLKWYFQPFAGTQAPDKLDRIVQRTARKMSAEGRARVLKEFDLPAPFASAFTD